MFGKKTQINLEDVHSLKDALRAIDAYIYIQEWEKGQSAIDALRENETQAFNELKEKISNNFEEVNKQKKRFEDTCKKIDQLEEKLKLKKLKYDKKIEEDRFNIRFTKIKDEINSLMKHGQNTDALNLLNNFFEETKGKTSVTNYYSKQKKVILQNIKKRQESNKNKIKGQQELEKIKKEEEEGIKASQIQEKIDKEQEEAKKHTWWYRAIDSIKFHQRIREKYERKKLEDEVKILLEEDSKAKEEIASKKLEHIHKGLIKEVEQNALEGYDLYGKILGSDTISGDSLGFVETKNKYNFYIGDATGHGVRAGLIVSWLSKTYLEYVHEEDIIHLTYMINNTLKEQLTSKHFVTGIIFEIDKKYKNICNIVGMGHEPLIVYRSKNHRVEKIYARGLAGGIRIIKDKESIQPQTIDIDNNDVVMTYSDGILEAKNETGEQYGIERLEKIFHQSCQVNTNIKEIYKDIIEDLKYFSGGSSFQDDSTILIFRRNPYKDVLNSKSDEIEAIRAKEGLNNKEVKRLEGKTKEEIEEELKEIRQEKQTLQVVNILKGLYDTDEFLKLKQEAIRYTKEGYIHKDINKYLRLAIKNEEVYRLRQKNTKMVNKFNVLKELYNKKDYNTVINECNAIIAKDGNI